MNVEIENLDLDSLKAVNFSEFDDGLDNKPGEFLFSLDPKTFDDEENTIKVRYTNNNKVLRYSWARGEYFYLQLSSRKGHVDLGRLNNGAAVLDSHNSYEGISKIMGAVVPGSATEKEATIKFSKRDDIQPFVQDIKDGILRFVSPGFHIHETKDITKEGDKFRTLLVTKWEPHEISFVAVPADAEAQAFSLKQEVEKKKQELSIKEEQADNVNKEQKMSETTEKNTPEASAAKTAEELKAVQAEAQEQARKEEKARSEEIFAIAKKGNLGMDFAQEMVKSGKTVDEVQKIAFNQLAEADEDQEIAGKQAFNEAGSGEDQEIKGAKLALEAKVGLSDRESGNKFNNFRLYDFAKFFADKAGEDTSMMSRGQIAEFALHSTSDFPNLLANVANKKLQKAYTEAPARYREFCSKSNLADFKPTQITKVSGAATPALVKEGGEYEQSTITDGKETYQLAKYGQIVSITKESIINDDLKGLDRLPMEFARASARKEQQLVAAILTGNPTMADGNALFHASHNNITDALLKASHATLDSWKTVVQLFRQQKGLLNDDDFLDLYPEFCIVGPNQEDAAYRIFNQKTVPTNPDEANPYYGKSKVIVLPQITNDEYFAVANPMDIEGITYGYLEGEEGPQISTRNGFRVDAFEIKMTLSFAAKAVDHRALVKSTNDDA